MLHTNLLFLGPSRPRPHPLNRVAGVESGTHGNGFFLSTHLLCIPQYLSQNFYLLACAQNPSKRTEIIYQYFLSPVLLPAHNSLSANFC